MQNSKKGKEVQGAEIAKELQDLKELNLFLQQQNEIIHSCYNTVQEVYKLAKERNERLELELQHCNKGIKNHSDDFFDFLDLYKGKLPPPDHLLHKDLLLHLCN